METHGEAHGLARVEMNIFKRNCVSTDFFQCHWKNTGSNAKKKNDRGVACGHGVPSGLVDEY